MDGLLIDSEPFWREAEKEVFAKVGITLTDEMCFQTVGLRIDEVVQYWHERLPWDGMSFEAIETAIVDEMLIRINADGKPLPGVLELISTLGNYDVKMAVASSSYLRLIDATLNKFGIYDTFDVVQSAESEQYGKPHPGVFLTTAAKLEVEPTKCLVFEDSIGGMVAAKAARMKCVVVPEAPHYDNPKFALADLKLPSLAQFSADHWKDLDRL